MIRVLLVDDQPLIRGGFRALLDAEDDIEVVAEAADGRQGVQLARRHLPDVALVDIQMPLPQAGAEHPGRRSSRHQRVLRVQAPLVAKDLHKLSGDLTLGRVSSFVTKRGVMPAETSAAAPPLAGQPGPPLTSKPSGKPSDTAVRPSEATAGHR